MSAPTQFLRRPHPAGNPRRADDLPAGRGEGGGR